MKNIKLQKIEIVEYKTLQSLLLNFVTYYGAKARLERNNPDMLFDIILLLDISSKLYYNFRSKIEKATKSTANFSCTCSEAVVLLKVCNNQHELITPYDEYIALKFTRLIHQELINLVAFVDKSEIDSFKLNQ